MLPRAWVVAATLASAALGCAGARTQGNGSVSSGGAPATGGATLSSGVGTTTTQSKGPPTLETCQAQTIPEGRRCHWTLLPTSYCGGPQPLPEMLWPHCSCEACSVDADCAPGARCEMLTTGEECNPVRKLCLDASSRCSDKGGCPPDERCTWVEGHPECKVPVDYLPRP